MTLVGAGMGAQTILKRAASASGTAIREKTAAEGNSGGATGLWIRDLYVDGNGTTGDGINIGNQVPGCQLNFNSGLENIHVRNFVGTGFDIYQNSAKSSYLWSNANTKGFITRGGSGSYLSLWAEGNTTYGVEVASAFDRFYGIHCEQEGALSNPSVILDSGANQNLFYGISVGLNGNRTNLVQISTGANRNVFYGTTVDPGAYTYSNLLYDEAWLFGTGSSAYMVPVFVDDGGVNPSYFFDGSSGAYASIGAGGNVRVGGNVGFYGHSPAAKPTVSGSKGANAALTSLLSALAGLGLITDSTT